MGDGPEAAGVARLVSRHPFRSRIRAYPGGADPRPFYQQAKILVISSVREGLPNVILEAMSMGRPVAATAVGGIPDLVVPDVTGLLCPPRNREALGETIAGLLADEDKRLAMGRAARERAVALYSMDAMVRRHETVFEQALAGKHAPAAARPDAEA